MLQGNAKNELVNVVNDLVSKGKLFSGYDLTRILRDKGYNVKNADVGKTILDLYNNDVVNFGMNYELSCTRFSVDGKDRIAIVYRPLSNTSTYDPNALKPATKQTSCVKNSCKGNTVNGLPYNSCASKISKISKVSLDKVVSGLKSDITKCMTKNTKDCVNSVKSLSNIVSDGSGRLCIRKSILNNVGINSSNVGVYYATNKIVLVKNGVAGPASMHFWGNYKVDKSGNIRLSKGLLGKAFKNSKNTFKQVSYINSVGIE